MSNVCNGVCWWVGCVIGIVRLGPFIGRDLDTPTLTCIDLSATLSGMALLVFVDVAQLARTYLGLSNSLRDAELRGLQII